MNCNCKNLESSPAGTTLKLMLTPEAEGFNPAVDNWTVRVTCGLAGHTYKVYTPSDMEEGDDGYIVVIDTTGMQGVLKAIVTAYVPDAQCAGGIRPEVVILDLRRITKV